MMSIHRCYVTDLEKTKKSLYGNRKVSEKSLKQKKQQQNSFLCSEFVDFAVKSWYNVEKQERREVYGRKTDV